MPQQFAVQATKRVPIDSVHQHPKNPRRGDIARIAESLEIHGQYRPIIVNADGTILAGNHTWEAAKSLGWSQIQASFVDVDEKEADQILVADNWIASIGSVDPEALTSILSDLGDVVGTGMMQSELDDMLEELAAAAAKAARDTPSDNVLRAVDVTVDDPEYMPGNGEVWKLGPLITLVCDDVFAGTKWRQVLEHNAFQYFLPYPGPFIIIGERLEGRSALLVQPDSYICGHIIRIWEQAFGGKAIQIEDGVEVPMVNA